MELLEDRCLLSASSLLGTVVPSLPGDDTAGNSPDPTKTAAGVPGNILVAGPEAATYLGTEDTEIAPADQPTNVSSGEVAIRGIWLFSQASGDAKVTFFDDVLQGEKDICVFTSIIS